MAPKSKSQQDNKDESRHALGCFPFWVKIFCAWSAYVRNN